MASLAETVSDGKCDDLMAIIDNGSSKFLCFTRTDTNLDNFIICASDGLDLWRFEMNEDEFDVLRDLSNMKNEAYLSSLRSGFQSGNLQVSQIGVKVNLTVGQGSRALSFDLYEAKAVEKKVELQTVLFHLAEKSSDLESKLSKTTRELETLRKQRATGGGASGGLGLDLDGGKGGKNQPKAQPKQVGMSILNPSSKKRKVARGVDFD